MNLEELKILLILDLDETLIHASEKELVVGRFPGISLSVYKRPFLEEFLLGCNDILTWLFGSSASGRLRGRSSQTNHLQRRPLDSFGEAMHLLPEYALFRVIPWRLFQSLSLRESAQESKRNGIFTGPYIVVVRTPQPKPGAIMACYLSDSLFRWIRG